MIKLPFIKKSSYKKLVVVATLGATMLSIAACGKKEEKDETTTEVTTTEASTENTATEDTASGDTASEAPSSEDATGGDFSNLSAREKLDYIKSKISFLYIPDMDVEPEIFEGMFGIAPDKYEDYVCEMPMISAKSDTIIIIKPTQEAYDEVLDTLTSYMKMLQEDAMQYPMNAIQLKATQILEKDGYIYYVALFGDMNDVMQDDDAVLKTCQNNVAEVISIIEAQ